MYGLPTDLPWDEVSPSILGADGAGEVVAVANDVEGIELGTSVVINSALNWGENQAFDGPDFSIIGMPTDGTYAQYVKVPAENVYAKPEYLGRSSGDSFRRFNSLPRFNDKGQSPEGEQYEFQGLAAE